jgi:ribosomal protein S18 acetylase RimI-like enzyme
MEHLVIRLAQPADFAAIRDLFDELDRFHAAAEPRLLRVPPAPVFSRDRLAELIACETCFLAVAELPGEVAGFVSASIQGADLMGVHRPWCDIDDLMVKSGRRHVGIGKALMRSAEDWARTKGLADVRLNVWEFNDGARAFYARLSYRTLSRQLHKALD